MAINKNKLGSDMGNAMGALMNGVSKPIRGEAQAAMRKQGAAKIKGIQEIIDHIDLNDERILALEEKVEQLENYHNNNNNNNNNN